MAAGPRSSRCLCLALGSTLCALGLVMAGPRLCLGQITTDGSLGPATSLGGPNFAITHELGQVHGSNLFHSFGQFNIRAGESATFSGPSTIANILSRVTGGQPSSINGVLRSTIAGANVFLLNPSGVLFGPNAQLDVSGSFHASTADVIRFTDGGTFFANPNTSSVLTAAAPSAFGFLGPNAAAIMVQESVLEVPEGRSLSLIGGDVSIVGGPVGLLRARSGRVTVGSVASPGDVTFDAATQSADVNLAGFSHLGSIELSGEAFLSTTGNLGGPGGGTVTIRGGRLVMRDSDLRANTNGDIDGARLGIDVRVGEDVVLDNSRVLAGSFAGGRAGDIVVAAGSVTTQNESGIETSTSATGRAGDLTVDAGRLTVTGGGGIGSNTVGSGQGGTVTIRASDFISLAGSGAGGPSRLFSFTDGTAPGGAMTVSAPTVALDGGIVLTRARGSGTAGDIVMHVSRLTLNGGSSVSGITFGGGGAGNVAVGATESVAVAQGSLISSRVALGASGNSGRIVISTPALGIDDGIVGGVTLSSAAAGDVEIRAGTVSLTAGGQIAAGTSSAGAGGMISITGLDPGQPADLVSLSGSGRIGSSAISSQTTGSGSAGRVAVFARSLNIDGGAITSNTFSSGPGGDIALNVGTLTATGRAFVSSSTGSVTIPEEATGPGGTVTVEATESVTMSSGSAIGAFSLGSGDAGRISIRAPRLSMDGGAVVTTLAAAGGRAGSVAINATDTVSITGPGTGLFSTASSTGDAGQIVVSGPEVTLGAGGQFSVSTSGAGSGGTMTINATGGTLTLVGGAGLFSTAGATGPGGDINATAARVEIRGATISASSTGTAEALAGNVNLVVGDALVMENGTITTGATVADGGNISITATGSRLHLKDSQITTAVQSGRGAGGNITIGASAQPFDFIVLTDSGIHADAFGGPGGNVNIFSDVMLSTIPIEVALTASSQLSTPGTIDIQARITDVSGTLADLPANVLQAATLLHASCAARLAAGKASSLVVAGREGVPPEPGGLLLSPLLESPGERLADGQGPAELTPLRVTWPPASAASPLFAKCRP